MLSLEDMIKKYKENICIYCINPKKDECNIGLVEGCVKCNAYKKNPNELIKKKPVGNWQSW